MKYIIEPLKVNDFSVFEENKLKKRSYFIPYTSREALERTTVVTRRYNSEKVNVLSGDDWGFKYFASISDLPGTIDPEFFHFDRISVPSTWQRTGYDTPNYLNVRYPFVVSYPTVPDEMSCAVYRKSFSIKESTKHAIITFLGVANNISLYVNGKYVGYSECSHNMSEFSLDGFVNAGENELLVVMSKWCNGTYLECQDMFRENGIFRDVYITEHSDDCYIYDYKITTSKSEDGYTLALETTLEAGADLSKYAIGAEFFDGEKFISSTFQNAGENSRWVFANLDVSEWSAETPKLYDLYVILTKSGVESEIVLAKVGFRNIEINGELFLFNGRKIKFKGVNHHDTNMKNGYVMTAAELEKDIKIMKEFNCNAVRTSHYPPDPAFIELCDEYGLYVVDEADIETHGTQFDETKGVPGLAYFHKANRLSNASEWKERYLDRVRGLYERDKNHCCVTMWSLGNESGGWKNQDACCEYLKERSTIPVHYEGAIRTPVGSYDVISEMYTHLPIFRRILAGRFGPRYNGKPYFLCEYCHAMGVGPGNLEDYWKLVYSSDKSMGGCIWEFADHAFYDENAKYKLTYGGDHNEERHDGNFCVDGLFFPDRTPHSGAYEMKTVYRPIRVELVSDNVYLFRNTNSFLDSSVYTITYKLYKDSKLFDSGIVIPDLKPLESKSIVLAHKSIDKEHDYYINFICIDKNGQRVSKQQIILNSKIYAPHFDKSSVVSVEKDGDSLVVVHSKGEISFNKRTGALRKYCIGDTVLAEGEDCLQLNICRAPIDNDRYKTDNWKKLGFVDAQYVPQKMSAIEYSKNRTSLRFTVYGKFIADGKAVFNTKTLFKIHSDGTMKVIPVLERKGINLTAEEIPQFGISLKLDKSLQNVVYYGRGDKDGLGECLSDFCQHAYMGIHSATVPQMTQNYIKPQENGTHTDTKLLELNNGKLGIKVKCFENPFTFDVHNYSNETLKNAGHIEDLTEDKSVTLNVLGFVRGAGSQSCGPDVLSDYKVYIKNELKFGIYIRPVII